MKTLADEKFRASLRPFKLHRVGRVRSTNEYSARLRRRGELFAPAVVWTRHQTAGRGRGSNTWWSGEGSLTATFAMAVDDDLPAHHVPLLAGLAVRDAAEACGVADVRLKWPNDLLVDDKKLAGILCERVDGIDLIGIGMNVGVDPADVPSPLRAGVTSANWLTGRPASVPHYLAAIASRLYDRIGPRTGQSFVAAVKEYDRHHALVGRRVEVHHTGSVVGGICDGLDDTGRLLLRDGRVVHRVIAGHVELFSDNKKKRAVPSGSGPRRR